MSKFMTKMRRSGIVLVLFSLLIAGPDVLATSVQSSPQEFAQSSAYQAYRALLQKAVLPAGPAERTFNHADVSDINSRIKENTRPSSYDGSRFLYEAFVKYPELKTELAALREAMAQLGSQNGFNNLPTDEQLAYWLNLHNLLVIEQIASLYPVKILQDLYSGPAAIIDKPLVSVAGQSLSLNAIKTSKILPLAGRRPEVIYGLYEGYISGPSIRNEPFTGQNLHAALQQNAVEFVNTSRGTYAGQNEFRASGFYQRQQAFFPDYPFDLKPHLQKYLTGAELKTLTAVNEVSTNLDDWHVTDLYGTVRASNDRGLDAEYATEGLVRETTAPGVSKGVKLSRRQQEQILKIKLRQQPKEGRVDIQDLPAEKVVSADKAGTDSGQ
ncbi:DUF547 domain-containing protein [Rheinheimera sp.]|uniref:DUF547 domain-containing protein n=1 Tax=Rheinheimera sp. TaxID=1869214 RepID=UPI003D2C7DC9